MKMKKVLMVIGLLFGSLPTISSANSVIYVDNISFTLLDKTTEVADSTIFSIVYITDKYDPSKNVRLTLALAKEYCYLGVGSIEFLSPESNTFKPWGNFEVSGISGMDRIAKELCRKLK